MKHPVNMTVELGLLALLALLWGSSYLFIKVAVAEIPPITLIAIRVSGATLCLLVYLGIRGLRLPTGRRIWTMLGIQAVFNSIGAWTILAWGQQFVDAGLASVLNSTAPIFVFLFTVLVTRHEALNTLKLAGAVLGIAGVAMVVGLDSLNGFGQNVMGQAACLLGATLYACAAIYGKGFSDLSAAATATATMIWASVVLVPLAFLLEKPWTLSASVEAVSAAAVLSIFCTGAALPLYFRLVHSLGSLGVASQAYLRSGIGVLLGIVVLGETMGLAQAIGILVIIVGVICINRPSPRAA